MAFSSAYREGQAVGREGDETILPVELATGQQAVFSETSG
jgi:hypothetical protein